MPHAIDVEFCTGMAPQYRSVLHPADSVDVEVEGGGWNTVGGPAPPAADRHAREVLRASVERWGAAPTTEN